VRAGVVIAIVLFAVTARAQDAGPAGPTAPPVLQAVPPDFTIRPLSGPVAIDGKAWIAAEPVSVPQTVRSSDGAFTVSLSEPNAQGDVRRFRLRFTGRSGRPVNLAPRAVSYVYVTPDSRWIFFEPLEVIDVRVWRRYSLSTIFNIQPYVAPQAISSDGRRLVIWRRECPLDCRGVEAQYYEVGLPAE